MDEANMTNGGSESGFWRLDYQKSQEKAPFSRMLTPQWVFTSNDFQAGLTGISISNSSE